MIQHVAVVPDGNRRWARRQGVSPLEGHQRGAEVMHRVADYLADKGVKYLTIWGFSTDNWKRTPEEVENILGLLGQWLESHTEWAHKRGIRLCHIGQVQYLPGKLREAIRTATELTSANQGMTLNVAFNYTGRAEILDAVRRLMVEKVPPHLVDESRFASCLYTDGTPDVDMVIRTAGDYRISNFLLWQSAYAEFYFTDVLWPDFSEEEVEKALSEYSERQRRFGGD